MMGLRKVIVTGLGTGYLPVAPGTWASAAACGVFLLVVAASRGSTAWANVIMAAVVVAASAGCVALGRFAESTFGRKDPQPCTIDEWAGQAVALLGVPVPGEWTDRLIVAGVAFAAFRVFDIVKPPPVRSLEKLPHGWGILADDLVAGLYANVAAQIVLRLVVGV